MLSRGDLAAPRGAHTLIELLMSLTLLTVIVGALVSVLVRQQRFHAAVAQVIDTRASVREAAEVMSLELRGISPGSGDVYAMTSTSIEYRAAIGASVLCAIDSADRSSIALPPTSPRGAALTAWHPKPDAGDSVMVYDPGATLAADDDAWRSYAIVAAPRAGICPMASGFTASAAEEARGYVLHLDRPLASSIPSGSALRFFRRSRYALYQGTDGSWYLGALDCLASRTPACSTIQPVSGPFHPPRAAEGSGLALTYRDSSGASTADVRAVARIDVTVRARSRDVLRMNGMTWAVFHDSTLVSIGVRN